jgi:four helix bundle protein
MGDYRLLKVWRRAHELTLAIYALTRMFPTSETYGLTSQLRRSAASIGANLAEGSGRNSSGDFVRFCGIALGSANELEYHLLLAHDLGYIDAEAHSSLAGAVDHVKRMLVNLTASARTHAAES